MVHLFAQTVEKSTRRCSLQGEQDMTEEDVKFLNSYTPTIFWNDVDCYYWAFPVKLPSGRWCEFMVSKDGQTWKTKDVPSYEEYRAQQEEKEKKNWNIEGNKDRKEKTEEWNVKYNIMYRNALRD